MPVAPAGPHPPAGAARAHHPALAHTRASWPSCSTATSRRPAAGCAMCACCAASPTPRWPTPGGRRYGPAYTRLLDVRDCLHLVSGRRRDRLFVQDLDEVAALLGIAGAEALRRRIADDARTIAYAVDDSLRAAERWLASQRHGGRRAGPVVRAPVAPDVVAQDGEVVLARAAVTPDGRPDAVAAGCRRGRPARPAHLARHAGVAGPPLPAVAATVADPRPGSPSPNCSAPARRWCPHGRRATGSA